MDYDAEDRREALGADPMAQEEPDLNVPQFQVLLRTTTGDHIIGSSQTVNDLVDQARYWLNATDTGAQITDGQIRAVILQELDPATGNYVDGQELPASSKQEAIRQIRLLGGR